MSSGTRILIVDDDDGIREFISMTLLDEGYQIATASHGIAALELVAHETFGLILLDLRMPIMDGWTFIQEYRRRPLPHTPIIVVTATRDVTDLAQQVDADGFLSKPFILDDLIKVVEKFVPCK